MKSLVLAAMFLLVLAPSALASPPAAGWVAADAELILATEAEGEGEEPAPSTTSVSEGGIEPAELAPPVSAEEAEDQWTARFLAPLVAILGAIGVVAAFALYGLRLRGRYRVVE